MSNPEFKPKFWHPDNDKPGINEERQTDENTANFTNFVYNSYKYLSIDQQRQKLPIFKNRNHIIYLLENFQTIVIVGETGSGKSTQIPQYLIEAGWGKDGKIVGVTQPRRVAATTLATRVAEEKGCIIGGTVGYSIRFDDCFSPEKTRIKFLTEGIMIREMMSDPLLSHYSVIMVDEAHERSLYTDILLGLLKKVLKKRPDLRVIVSSATLEAEQMKDFFNRNDSEDLTKDNSTILSIEGRLHPVDVFYVNEPIADYVKAPVDTVIKINEAPKNQEGLGSGDILVFLTGQEEVEHVTSLLIDYASQLKDRKDLMKLLILPMFSALPYSEQLKVFKPSGRGIRKVVVATNIAEASITIPGIVHVIDCGFVKLKYFNPKTRNDSLVIVPISQASAIQRSGRAGRIRAGKTYRLYPVVYKTLDTSFSLFKQDRVSKKLGLSPIIFVLVPPPSQNMIHAVELLYALGGLDDDGKLTNPIGIRMAEFPLHPMFAKMLLSSVDFGCTEEAVIIAALLQVNNVFLSPYGQAAIQAVCADNIKAKHSFSVKEGDHLTLLNVFTAFQQNPTKSWCHQNFLNYKGLVRAVEIKSQLEKLLRKFKLKIISCEGDTDAVCRCIVSGFFSNAAYLHHSGIYRTIRGDYPVHIHPSSVLYTEKQPPWIVFGEVLHTSMEYIRDITVIEPPWLYELAPHYYRYGGEGG
ncbi:putative ATP-dependent RNA helicase DHX35 [Nymphon striatum]|nr:putative ATP-dependent RNA helicase DHX35 [Nymphon striatum]